MRWTPLSARMVGSVADFVGCPDADSWTQLNDWRTPDDFPVGLYSKGTLSGTGDCSGLFQWFSDRLELVDFLSYRLLASGAQELDGIDPEKAGEAGCLEALRKFEKSLRFRAAIRLLRPLLKDGPVSVEQICNLNAFFHDTEDVQEIVWIGTWKGICSGEGKFEAVANADFWEDRMGKTQTTPVGEALASEFWEFLSGIDTYCLFDLEDDDDGVCDGDQ